MTYKEAKKQAKHIRELADMLVGKIRESEQLMFLEEVRIPKAIATDIVFELDKLATKYEETVQCCEEEISITIKL